MSDVLRRLLGGDRRSIGDVPAVVRDVIASPALFGELFEGMVDSDPLVRMRAADAVEKISAMDPSLLLPYKRRLLHESASVDQPDVRWHIAQMIPRLRLNDAERRAAADILLGYMDGRSRIVIASALTALADLAEHDGGLRIEVVRLLRGALADGSPAVKSRARRLLRRFEADELS